MSLPLGWATVEVSDLAARMFDGPFGSSLKSSDYTSDGVRVARLENIGRLRFRSELESFISRGKAATLERHTLRGGDILFSSFMDQDTRVCLVPSELDSQIINKADCFCVRTDPRACDTNFLAYRLLARSAYEALTGMVRGVTRPRIGLRDLAKLEVELPPLAEQRRIVAKLDALTARLARARAELDRVDHLSSSIKRVVASHAFSAIDDVACIKFADVLDYKGGSQPPKSTFHSEPAKGRIRLLQIRDFASDSKAVYIDDNGKWPRCSSDDVMIGRYGASVGKILSGKAGAYNVALVRMIFDPAIIDRRFLFHWLRADVFQSRLKEISRSAQDGFNKEDLADLDFPLLPFGLQQKIASSIDNYLARADRLEAEAARGRALLDRLEAAILAKAFRGELVPQDPNDEPAAILLNRIRAQRAAAPAPKRGRKARGRMA